MNTHQTYDPLAAEFGSRHRGPACEHYEDDKFRQCEQRLREAELLRHITPAELVNRQLVQRCEELQESNARLADENQRLRRTIGDLCA